jgi:hypothetical protein
MKTANHWQKKKSARHRWSKNAVRAKERKRLERAHRPVDDLVAGKPPKLPRIPFDLKVNLERRDGGRLQFTLHHFYGKLVSQNVMMTPKQFGRKLGEIFALWIKE